MYVICESKARKFRKIWTSQNFLPATVTLPKVISSTKFQFLCLIFGSKSINIDKKFHFPGF